MKKYKMFFIVFCFLGCIYVYGEKDNTLVQNITSSIMKANEIESRVHPPLFFTTKGKLAKELYNAVDHASGGYEPEWVEQVLQKGADPNYCKGECGWWDNNPLMVLIEGVNVTYYNIPEMIPDADVQVMKMLLESKADIHLLPYIWYRVYLFGNDMITSIEVKERKKGSSSEEILKHVNSYLSDNNRLLKAFLEAGADPDMRGDPYPFSFEARRKMNDKIAYTFFQKGTRSINEAIKKGINWESQVDLLLQYVKLDEDSLKAAVESNDPKMIEKINILWKKQQEKK